jgi:NitT/TauT family transport system substrate-binding protein
VVRHGRLVIAGLLVVSLVGCRRGSPEQRPFRLGYFPNLTHAQALVGDAQGAFARGLGGELEVKRFNAGPSAMQAMLAGELDATYVGSGPAINTYVRSGGVLRVIAGAASGGSVLVVRSARSAADLRGQKVASPQLGGSQDISLRAWLREHGLETSSGGGGDVTIVPIANPDILSLFLRGELAGAWVPEPWGARLVHEGGGRILFDERELWPGGRFPPTVLVASRQALEHRPDQVRRLLEAHVALTREARDDPERFQRAALAAFERQTGRSLPPAVVRDAFARIDFTVDPMPEQLAVAARRAHALGFLPRADVTGLVDRRLLDAVLSAAATRHLPDGARR